MLPLLPRENSQFCSLDNHPWMAVVASILTHDHSNGQKLFCCETLKPLTPSITYVCKPLLYDAMSESPIYSITKNMGKNGIIILDAVLKEVLLK